MLRGVLDDYQLNGFARVPQVLGEEDLAMLRAEWARLWGEIDPAHPSIQSRGHARDGSRADRIDPAYVLSPALHALCLDPRLLSLAEGVLGRPAALFKDKLITKSSGTHGYGLHQDWPYWQRFGAPADHLVTVQIAIDPCDQANGALEVWPKVRDVLPAPADEPLDVDPRAVADEAATLVALEPGDALLLHPLAPHRSATNRSDRPRRAYFVTYVSAEHEAAARMREAEVRSLLAAG